MRDNSPMHSAGFWQVVPHWINVSTTFFEEFILKSTSTSGFPACHWVNVSQFVESLVSSAYSASALDQTALICCYFERDDKKRRQWIALVECQSGRKVKLTTKNHLYSLNFSFFTGRSCGTDRKERFFPLAQNMTLGDQTSDGVLLIFWMKSCVPVFQKCRFLAIFPPPTVYLSPYFIFYIGRHSFKGHYLCLVHCMSCYYVDT